MKHLVMCLLFCLLITGLCACQSPSNGDNIDIGPEGTDNYSGQLEYYRKEKGKVYFIKVGFVDIKYYQNKTLLEDADYNSFVSLGETDGKSSTYFAKDNKHVYYSGEIMEGADPATFEYVQKYFAKDQSHVYCGNQIMEGAAPATFVALNGIYGKDSKSIYYFNLVLSDVDYETFQVFEDYAYATDKNHVYYGSEIVEDMDAATFSLLNGFYTRDKNQIYFLGKPIPGVDMDSLKVINDVFVLDINYVYQNGTPVVGSNPATFELREINPEEYKYSTDFILAQDKNYTYYRCSEPQQKQ